MAASGRTERLWREFLRDPSQWWDKRKTKRNPNAPDFQHRVTRDSLWIETFRDPVVLNNVFELLNGTAIKPGQVEAVKCNNQGECDFGIVKLLPEDSSEMGGLSSQENFSWGSLIGHDVKHGNLLHAVAMYYLIDESDFPEINGTITYTALLKACTKLKDLQTGTRLHLDIMKNGILETGNVIGRTLVHMYVKCGSLCKAKVVFDQLVVHDVVTWTSLLTASIECGHETEALSWLEQMQYEGVLPDDITLVCGLKACGILGAIDKGHELHSNIVKEGLDQDIFVCNALLGMYVKCGRLLDGEEIFRKIASKNVVSWNSLICGYVENGYDHDALECFVRMQIEHVSPDDVTIISCLKASGNLRSTGKNHAMHADVVKLGMEKDPQVANALIDMYVNSCLLMTAHQVFTRLEVRDNVSWNTLISGYLENNCDNEVLLCVEQMRHEGCLLDNVALVSSLKSCGRLGLMKNCQETHTEIIRRGLDQELSVSNTLIDTHAKCGSLAEARKIFDKLLERNIVSWNTLISAYLEQGNYMVALECFVQMSCEGVSLDDVTLLCCVKTCANLGVRSRGEEIHSEIIKKGYESSLILGNSLVDMYCKCGSLAAAKEVFEGILLPDVISWNALISGFVEHGNNVRAMDCFSKMKNDGICGDHITYMSTVKACGSEGIMSSGREMHAEITMRGMEVDLFVGNILVDMYARCGGLEEAQNIFDKLSMMSIASCNALITGYAQLGGTGDVASILERMTREHLQPNEVSFMGILTACSHAGVLYNGYFYFRAMMKYFNIMPSLEHYTCMVDLLGRAGRIDEAMECIQWMPFQPSVVICHTLLGSCRKWGVLKFALQAFKHIVQLDDRDIAPYGCLSSLYMGSSST